MISNTRTMVSARSICQVQPSLSFLSNEKMLGSLIGQRSQCTRSILSLAVDVVNCTNSVSSLLFPEKGALLYRRKFVCHSWTLELGVVEVTCEVSLSSNTSHCPWMHYAIMCYALDYIHRIYLYFIKTKSIFWSITLPFI